MSKFFGHFLVLATLLIIIVTVFCISGFCVDNKCKHITLPQIPLQENISRIQNDNMEMPIFKPSDKDVEYIAKTIYGEARGINSKMHQAAVAWCILNRVDSPHFPDTIEQVVTQKAQFSGYNENHPATEEFKQLANDVLYRWHNEKQGIKNVGRVLPKNYCYFIGDGEYNYFMIEWRSEIYWSWTVANPYFFSVHHIEHQQHLLQ